MKSLVITICLALTVALTQLELPAPCLAKGKSSQPQKQSRPTQKQSATDQRGTEQSPVVVKVLPPTKTKEAAANDRLLFLTCMLTKTFTRSKQEERSAS